MKWYTNGRYFWDRILDNKYEFYKQELSISDVQKLILVSLLWFVRRFAKTVSINMLLLCVVLIIKNVQEIRLQITRWSLTKRFVVSVQSSTNWFSKASLVNMYTRTVRSQTENSAQNRDMLRNFDRLLFDGGTQLTFIKECLSRRLGLPVTGNHSFSIMSFGKSDLLVWLGWTKAISYRLDWLKQSEWMPEICFDRLSSYCRTIFDN